MGITLKQSQTVAELAKYLYDFLPGKPHRMRDQTIVLRVPQGLLK